MVFNAVNSNLISISDVDDTSHTVTLTGTNGTMSLSGIAGLSFTTGDGTGDASMVFSGTDIDINSALNGMSCQGSSSFNGAASVQIKTTDSGPLTDTDTVNITV